ncbi:lpg1661 family Dot/Icm T4SS effector [soil metagenome]
MTNTLTRGATDRLISLDVFRGLTIAGMVLVNNPGSWSHIYWPLAHAEWHGWTPTDLIFPFFLFIVGVAIPLAFGRRVDAGGAQRDLYLKVMKRTLIIFALGLFLNGFPYFNLSTIRIPGVLQRIAVCYLLASIIFLKSRVRTQIVIVAALLLVYWLLMACLSAPGFARGDLSKEGSVASFIDRLALGSHIWSQGKVYDPEGLLSTIPALATTLLGALTGQWLRTPTSDYEKVAGMFVAGMCCLVIGWAWHPFFPINKSLWTSSYVLFTGGMALQLLGFCYWLADIKDYRAWAKPFVVFGVNAIALFVGTGIMAKLMGIIKIPLADGSRPALKNLIYSGLFVPWAPPKLASLSFAIAFILLWLGLMWILYSRKIFIKV